MITEPTEVAKNPIRLRTVPQAFTPDGLAIDSPNLLAQLGVNTLSELAAALVPTHGPLHKAPTGVIQDPAGAAIGVHQDPLHSGAAGMSALIYQQFPDLKPIPAIAVGSAIFNGSTGPGRRVLHSHSRQLTESPHVSEDRRKVMEYLANAYANALEAVRGRAAVLGQDAKPLNLVPLSAGIFAGDFGKNQHYTHLHPSYTICAIVLALDWWRGAYAALPSLNLYFSDEPVYIDANAVMDSLTGAT